jgi:hypothetical protein
VLPILRLEHIFDHGRQVIIVVNTFPIAAHRPNGTGLKNRPPFSQASRAIGFQLVARDLPRNSYCSNDYVYVVAAGIPRPHMPAAMQTMPIDFSLNHALHLNIEQNDRLFQAISVPLRE